MDPVESLLVSYAANIGARLTAAACSKVMNTVYGRRPDLKPRLNSPTSPADLAGALQELGGVFELLAGEGTIEIDGPIITAIRAARFDHQNGSIVMGNLRVKAAIVQGGGSGPGQTVVGENSVFESQGTKMIIGKGCTMIVTGNAKWIQN